MEKPKIPANEKERLDALQDYHILDTLPEDVLDNIAKLASYICNTPIALVSLIDRDRQWFKSHIGLAATETPRELAFCAHAINYPGQLFIVPDSRLDSRFADNPLVTGAPNVVFYAGVPLVNPDGFSLGTLCIIDNQPKNLNNEQKEALSVLAQQVINVFELRKINREYALAKKILEERNSDLEKFASVVSHDIKSPLSNIISFVDLFKMRYVNLVDEKGVKMLNLISRVSYNLKDLVDGILSYYRSDPITLLQSETIELNGFFTSMFELIKVPENAEIIFPQQQSIYSKRNVLKQIFINLITNSIRYNDKEKLLISIGLTEDENFYYFSLSDNGIGINETDSEKIFELFSTLNKTDQQGAYSTGIGLATVKKLITNLHGEINVSSIKGIETTFRFSIKKLPDHS
ncbi:MAG: ATP-binding protein [Prolixibacteraceae bacterium]